jgi:GAF domain-containing protein
VSETEFDASLNELHDYLLAEATIEGALDRVARLARAALPCEGAGVSMLSNGSGYTTASAGGKTDVLDQIQYDTDEGPCLEAARTGQVVVITDLVSETRWPSFVTQAVNEGLVSSVSVPLVVGNDSVGALNLYSLSRGLDEGDVRTATRFGRAAAVLLANTATYVSARKLGENLEVALESRDVIGQAKGLLMARHGCTSDQAFALLREGSQRRNIKLRDLAQEMVDEANTANGADRT